MTKFENVVTKAAVVVYDSSRGIFQSLLTEIKELSKKKPEATMSPGKVKIINRVLDDLLTILKDEPEGKYLDTLDDETLPQISDAVLVMVQFESALESFWDRYHYSDSYYSRGFWVTAEKIAELKEEGEYDEFEVEDSD